MYTSYSKAFVYIYVLYFSLENLVCSCPSSISVSGSHALFLSLCFFLSLSLSLCLSYSVFPCLFLSVSFSLSQPEAKHGTSIFAKIQLENVNHYNTNTLEATIAYDPIRKIHIVCVYRFPSSSIPKFVEDLKLIPATLTDEKKVIMGDFNMNTHGKNQQTIANICKDMRTQQLVKEPTTKHNTVIDDIHTNIKDYRAVSVLKTYYSDHDQIFIQL